MQNMKKEKKLEHDMEKRKMFSNNGIICLHSVCTWLLFIQQFIIKDKAKRTGKNS